MREKISVPKMGIIKSNELKRSTLAFRILNNLSFFVKLAHYLRTDIDTISVAGHRFATGALFQPT